MGSSLDFEDRFAIFCDELGDFLEVCGRRAVPSFCLLLYVSLSWWLAVQRVLASPARRRWCSVRLTGWKWSSRWTQVGAGLLGTRLWELLPSSKLCRGRLSEAHGAGWPGCCSFLWSCLGAQS